MALGAMPGIRAGQPSQVLGKREILVATVLVIETMKGSIARRFL